MVDVFARKGVRLRGQAVFHRAGSARAEVLAPRWAELFGAELMERSSGFVIIDVASVKSLTTSAYDVGAIEQDLRRDYLARFTAMQTAWLTAQTKE